MLTLTFGHCLGGSWPRCLVYVFLAKEPSDNFSQTNLWWLLLLYAPQSTLAEWQHVRKISNFQVRNWTSVNILTHKSVFTFAVIILSTWQSFFPVAFRSLGEVISFCLFMSVEMTCWWVYLDRLKWPTFISFHCILLKTIHSRQSQTVTIHTELDSEATEHRQLPMS